MKKLVFLFLPCVILGITGIINATNTSYSSWVTLIQEVQACDSYIECSDGSTIDCHGQKSCSAWPTSVTCDGNQSSSC